MSNNSHKETILIVDDNPQSIDIMGEILKPYYRRQVARSGENALAISASDLQPDLILLDVMMPGIDGYEVCRRLKADEKTRNIPVIFITAKNEIEDEAKGLEIGAVDYITKPIKPPILLARVKTHLELKKARVDLEKQNEILKENVRLREDVDRITRHDLKNPLSSIIGFPDAIKMAGDLNEEQTEMLDMMEESGYKMLDMINLSLDLYKMETGKYKFAPVPVNLLAVVNKIFKEIKDEIEARKLSTEVLFRGKPANQQDLFLVQGDELLCYSMLSNLIKNAVEASPVGEQVEVAMTSGESAVIGIHNSGSVPLYIRETFFEKYTTSGKSGGTGLGTYSAKLIAQTLGGNIKFDTSDVAGTTITIVLPKY
jgi:two-component system sensor histidine kinase/response regulator